jgi:hypothetical protein
VLPVKVKKKEGVEGRERVIEAEMIIKSGGVRVVSG